MFYNYVLTYHPGMFGEFLCTQINKDKKYWPSADISHSYKEVNRYYHYSVIQTKYNIWPESMGVFNDKLDSTDYCAPVITPDLYKKIDIELNGKHTLLHGHFIYKNFTWLPRMKKVRLYVNEDDYLLPLLLKCIKAFNLTHNPWIMQFLEKHNQCPELLDEIIKDPDSVSFYELIMIGNKFTSLKEYNKFNIELWKRKAVKLEGYNDWIFLNPLDLLNDPNKHMQEWKDVFNLDNDFEFSLLKQYHKDNLSLIENTFGYAYEELKCMDIEQILFDLFIQKMKFFRH